MLECCELDASSYLWTHLINHIITVEHALQCSKSLWQLEFMTPMPLVYLCVCVLVHVRQDVRWEDNFH